MASAEVLTTPPATDRVEHVLKAPIIVSFLSTNARVQPRVRAAAEQLVKEHPGASDEEIVRTVARILPALADGTMKVFFGYRAKDQEIAEQVASWLEQWSAGKLDIDHMARFAIEQPGKNWREHILDAIPRCDWFLLLLPTPGEQGTERDWVMFEAGYYLRGQDLASRLVCLHHPQNVMADALKAHQFVSAEPESVEQFLKGLFKEEHWIPGMPPLNKGLEGFDAKARDIVGLIRKQPKSSKSCCGAHLEVAFSDASAVTGWQQLAAGRVLKWNDECKRLFRLQVPKLTFGEWLGDVEGAGKDEGWVLELAHAVRATGEGRDVPSINSTFSAGDGDRVRPAICAVSRRENDLGLESVNIYFGKKGAPPETTMSPSIAALAATLEFSVRFRYQLLEHYAGKKIDAAGVASFAMAMQHLERQTMRDPRFSGDPKAMRARTTALFDGDDKDVVDAMYERADQMWRPDFTGEMDVAIMTSDGDKVAALIDELVKMNQRFLEVTSKRFAELLAKPAY
jgi:hypothetical protein